MKKKLMLLSLLGLTLGSAGAVSSVSAEALAYGNRSDSVHSMQSRLSSLGYFKEGATGYYGHATLEAVRNFQRAYGLPADGEADSLTLDKLKTESVHEKDVDKLARIIYSEARGESFQGQVAVGAVVMNRLQSPMFPDSIEKIITEPRQFTAVQDGQYWLQPNRIAYKAAYEALAGSDPTGNALFYYNPKISTSKWVQSRTKTVKIGNHIFAK